MIKAFRIVSNYTFGNTMQYHVDYLNDRDKTLSEEARLNQVKGKVAIANAKIAYQKYKEIIASDRWKMLTEKGANVQRLLWASTSTKNPDYSDVC
jgi:transaldolase